MQIDKCTHEDAIKVLDSYVSFRDGKIEVSDGFTKDCVEDIEDFYEAGLISLEEFNQYNYLLTTKISK
jgi:hypothetical protein